MSERDLTDGFHLVVDSVLHWSAVNENRNQEAPGSAKAGQSAGCAEGIVSLIALFADERTATRYREPPYVARHVQDMRPAHELRLGKGMFTALNAA